MPQGGGDCCATREDRMVFTQTIFCDMTFLRVPYFDVPATFVRCPKRFVDDEADGWEPLRLEIERRFEPFCTQFGYSKVGGR